MRIEAVYKRIIRDDKPRTLHESYEKHAVLFLPLGISNAP